jgi:hypothetical protein
VNVGLVIAGVLSVGLAFGHATIGLVWVLPRLPEEHLPTTPFGPRSLTIAMVRVTWHIVTIFALSTGAVLVALAWAPASDTKTLLLRSFSAMWLIATAMAMWIAARRMRSLRGLLRLPVPMLWVVIAVLCWTAST